MSLRYRLTGLTTLHQEMIYYVSLETDPDNGWFAVCDREDESYWHDLADWSPKLKENTALPNWETVGVKIVTNGYGMVAVVFDNDEGTIAVGPYAGTDLHGMTRISRWIHDYLVDQ